MKKISQCLVVILIPMFMVNLATGQTLRIWVDRTSSVLSDAREDGVRNLYNQLRQIIKNHNITEVQVGILGHDAYITLTESFQIPQLKCDPCPEVSNPGELSKIIKPIISIEREKAEALCREQRNKEKSEYDREFKAKLSLIEEALSKKPKRDPPCTAFYDMLARISKEPDSGIEIIVSDALETCQSSIYAIQAPATHKRVIILLSPSKNEVGRGKSTAGLLDKRRNFLLSLAPWLKVEHLLSKNISQLLD